MKPIWQERRYRYLTSALLALTITGVVVVAALADAPDPKIPSQNPSFTFPNITTAPGPTAGTTRVTVTTDSSTTAGWVWTTHHKDCNTDRAGAGFAVDWNDPSDPGFHVTTLNGDSIDVGSTSTANGNTVDNVVHPTPGTRVSSTVDGTGKETDVETPSQYTNWRGGCGTFTRDLNGDGIKDPEGDWGPRAKKFVGTTTFGSTTGSVTAINETGISHIYLTADVQRGITICAIMYDVHSGKTPVQNGGVGIPKGASEVTAGGSSRNKDNGAEANTGTPVGNACVPIPIGPGPTSTTTTQSVLPNDTGTVTGNNPTGTLTFKLFPPSNPTCSVLGATPLINQTVSLPTTTANSKTVKTTNSVTFVTTPGVWTWQLIYVSDNVRNPSKTVCGTETFTIKNS
jgi:hypothetical protein